MSFRKKTTRESHCLAGEPKHFPFPIVFVLIIKITLTCTRVFPKEMTAKMAAEQEYYVCIPVQRPSYLPLLRDFSLYALLKTTIFIYRGSEVIRTSLRLSFTHVSISKTHVSVSETYVSISGDSIRKNCELYVNLTILAVFSH